MSIVKGFVGKLTPPFRSNNKLPAYTIRENGIKREMVNPENIEEMPYDLDTYGSCQVFFKDYASPIKIDTKDIGDTLDGNDVISSKKYKTFMNQNVLKQIFSGSGLEMKKLLWIMFISLGLNVITLLAVMMVIAG